MADCFQKKCFIHSFNSDALRIGLLKPKTKTIPKNASKKTLFFEFREKISFAKMLIGTFLQPPPCGSSGIGLTSKGLGKIEQSRPVADFFHPPPWERSGRGPVAKSQGIFPTFSEQNVTASIKMQSVRQICERKTTIRDIPGLQKKIKASGKKMIISNQRKKCSETKTEGCGEKYTVV